MMFQHLNWQRCLIAALLFTLFVVAGVELSAAGRPILSGALIRAVNDGARVTLDLSANVHYRVFTLANPDRVVIDMDRVSWRVSGAAAKGDGLVRRLRHGIFKSDTSRVVIDCVAPVRVGAVNLNRAGGGAARRLVVDLVALSPPTHKPAPAPAAVAPDSRVVKVGWTVTPPRRKPRSPLDRYVVVIDAGHGGADPGATGVSGIREKDVTLRMARLLRDQLRRRHRYTVVMTRDKDVFIRLRKRIAIARAAKADLFLSLHADAHPNPGVHGASVYTLSEKASDREAAALADRENKADLIVGVDLSHESPEVANILIDLAQRETLNQSARLASGLVDELHDETHLLRNSHRFAGFAVLKAPDVPSVLIEMGYLSNGTDERMLRKRAKQDALARAIARAVDRYFDALKVAQNR